MLLTDPSSSSNWDFTPVTDLLRSPTYRGGGKPSVPSTRCNEVSVESCPRGQSKDVDDNNDGSLKQKVEDAASGGYHKLGDFTSVWQFLGRPTALPSTNTAKVELSNETGLVTKILQPSYPRQAVPRTSRNAKVDDDDHHQIRLPSPTAPRDIPISGNYKNRNSVGIRKCSTNSEGNSSHTSAELDSDNSSSVFDPPVSGKGGTAILGVAPGDTPPSSCNEGEGLYSPKTTKGLPASSKCLRPNTYKYASEQRVGLLAKLKETFPEYAEADPRLGKSRGTHRQSQRPIHIFVDSSNIMAGFNDSVKVSRGIPVKNRIRRLPLSFHNFSLILERGRPVAKRVLVGSDRFAEIEEAEEIGYEANILDRVHKVKHPRPRQSKRRKPIGSKSADTRSGSETDSTPNERWVEQGVDEILHLKILESLLDTKKPATIVLATGDAAEAEYSGGFMRMVERALERGWTVELVSFWQITSHAYRKKEFRTKWGNRFRLVKLDDYLEELWDM